MRKKQASILIVDDDDAVLFSARVWLKNFFEEIIITNSPKEILTILGKQNIDVILLDMNFRRGFEDGKEGLYWLKQIQELNSKIPILLMTAYGEIELAIEALKNGATDFILKPWNNDKLYASVNMAVDLSRKNRKLAQWENLNNNLTQYHLETSSPKMLALMQTLKKVAPTDANILLLGENGTGKYVMAEYIHQNSERRKEPFVHIDLGSLAENLFESELFGYNKGAFTDAKQNTAGKLENANGGTVFLDEIGNLPPQLQQKLLSLIQTKSFSRLGDSKKIHLDIRFIFATNASIQKMVLENSFREDLYYRINTVEVEIPPLRERTEDLEAMSLFFLNKFQNKYKKEGLKITNWEMVKAYSFLGNIRELEHLIERAVILADKSEISLQLNPKDWEDDEEKSVTLNLEEMEEKLIKKALKKHQGNISLTAEALGLSRAALYRRMEKFGI